MNPYNFYQADWPSIDDVRTRLEKDQELPSKERGVLLANLDWILWLAAGHERFKGWHIGNLPFAGAVFDGILRDTGEMPDSVEVRSNRAGLDAVLVRYRLTTKLKAASIASEWLALYRQVAGHRARDLKRFLMFLSSNHVKPKDVTAALSEGYRDAIMRDPTVKHWKRAWIQALRDWNWAAMRIEGWPDLEFNIPSARPKPKGKPWSAFRVGLEKEVQAALQPKPGFLTNDEKVLAAYARDRCGLEHSVELVRICLGALASAGISTDEIASFRDFLTPDRFSKIASWLFVDAGKKVTRSVRAKIATLHTLATRSGVLTKAELEAVGQTLALYDVRHKAYCKTHLSRAKKAASELDWNKVLEALHEIVLDTYAEAPPQRIKRADAAKKKQAAMLALRLATGLSSVLISRLEFKKHFVELIGDRAGCLQVVVPAEETANGLERKATLPLVYSQIIREFFHFYRPALDISGQSPFLFPSIGREPLVASTISGQQTAFIRSHPCAAITPEVIREIKKQHILSEDPKATGVVSGFFGLRDHDYVARLAQPFKSDTESRKRGRLIVDGRLRDKSSEKTPTGEPQV